MVRIALLGAAAVDTVVKVESFPGIDEIVFPISINKYPGGSTANIAVGLKRLGLDTVFLGKIGGDEDGKFILNEFIKEGVDTSKVLTVMDERSAGAFIAVNNSGERVMFSLGGAALYDRASEIGSMEFQELDGLFIGEAFPQIGALAGKRAKESGAKVFYSPGGLICRYGLDYIMEMLESCDYLFLNLPEAYILTGCTDKAKAVEKLLCSGVHNAVITEGSKGAGFYSSTDNIFIEACKAEAVDTTGAGDSFTAGFIKGIYMNYGTAKCLKLGNACAALAIGRLGARSSMPNFDEVIEYIGQEL